MKNTFFSVGFDPADGTISSIISPRDGDGMNWTNCGKWGLPKRVRHDLPSRGVLPGFELKSHAETADRAESVYEDGELKVTVLRRFKGARLVETVTVKNVSPYPVFPAYGSFSVSIPFYDVYASAAECLKHRCNAHIWCGGNVTYVYALKMGESDTNLGLFLVKGAFDGYSEEKVENPKDPSYQYASGRGSFFFNAEPFELEPGEEYVLEWELFWFRDRGEFDEIISSYENYVGICAGRHTVFSDENISFTAGASKEITSARVVSDGKEIPFETKGKTLFVTQKPEKYGHLRYDIELNGVKTYTEFYVSLPLRELADRRINYIIDRQQYGRAGSRLSGAYLIYDTVKECKVFEQLTPDHNAQRERLGMALLIAYALRNGMAKDAETAAKWQKSLDLYTDFFFREVFLPETGQVFNGLRISEKDQTRLYNIPWAATYLTELYLLKNDKEYLVHAHKILLYYYENGGYKFYANALSPVFFLRAYEKAGMEREYGELRACFIRHADNMVAIGLDYPPHEVVFEQTVVCPAAAIIFDAYRITGDEKYLREAKKHLAVLLRFNGIQPSYHLRNVAIRYWDDYWFGKSRLVGDTFPHYWSCLTSNAEYRFGRETGDASLTDSAYDGMRNILSLFEDNGSAHAAYVYADNAFGTPGGFYDDWANDQDFGLYYALKMNNGDM